MNDDTPLVSVCIPAYNAEPFIEETLRSVMRQTYTNIEIIVSDNASTDRTAEIIQKLAEVDSRIRYIRLPENIGGLGNWNFVVGKASSEYIALYHADDVYEPTIVEREFELLRERKAGAIFTSCHTISDSLELQGISDRRPLAGLLREGNVCFIQSLREFFEGTFRFGYFCCTPSMMVHASVFRRVGGYRNEYAHGVEDVDFVVNMLEKGTTVAIIDEPLIRYRRSNVQGTQYILDREFCPFTALQGRLFDDTLQRHPELLSASTVRTARKKLSKRFFNHALTYYRYGRTDDAFRALELSRKQYLFPFFSWKGIQQRFFKETSWIQQVLVDLYACRRGFIRFRFNAREKFLYLFGHVVFSTNKETTCKNAD